MNPIFSFEIYVVKPSLQLAYRATPAFGTGYHFGTAGIAYMGGAANGRINVFAGVYIGTA